MNIYAFQKGGVSETYTLFFIGFKCKIIIKYAAKLNFVCMLLLWIIKRLLLMWCGHLKFYLFKTKDPH